MWAKKFISFNIKDPDKGGKFEMFEFDLYVFQVSAIVILILAKMVQLVPTK